MTLALGEIKRLLREPGLHAVYSLERNELFKAIEVASPALSKSMRQGALRGASPNETAGLHRSLERYAKRAAFRATPFGLFAGVGPVDAEASKVIDGVQIVRSRSARGHSPILDSSSPLEYRVLYSNATLRVAGAYGYVPELVLQQSGTRAQQSLFRTSPLLLEIWRYCASGRNADQVRAFIESARPGSDAAKADDLLRGMVRSQVLFLLEERTRLCDIVGNPGQDAGSDSQQIVRTFLAAGSPPAEYVSRRVESVVRRLFRHMQEVPDTAHRDRFGTSFLEKYGAGVRVSYLVATNAASGIGQIDLQEAISPLRTIPVAKRTEVLQSLIMRAARDGSNTAELSESDIEALSEESRSDLGVDTDVLYSLDSTTGLVHFRPMPTTSLGGQSLGRFWDQVSPEWFESCLSPTNPLGEEVEPVQLWYFPRFIQSLDVMHSPQVTERYIALGVENESDPQCIPLAHLELLHDGQRLLLFEQGSDIPLVVRNLSMFNYPQLAPPDAQTLMTIGREIERDWVPFNWGSESAVSQLPRVTYRQVVVSKALWRLPTILLNEDLSLSDWTEEFVLWRDACHVPNLMEFGAGDNLLVMSTVDESSFSEIRRSMSADSAVAFESTPLSDSTAVEYIQRVRVEAKRKRKPERNAYANSPSFVHRSPAIDWISFELVGGRRREPAVSDLEELVSVAGRLGVIDWHFVRYNRPDLHTRLRFRIAGDNSERTRRELEVSAFLLLESSLSNVRIVPFLPEYLRYGGEPAFADIARAFTLSSEAALQAELSQRRLPGHSAHLGAAVDSAVTSLRFLFGNEWSKVTLPAIAGNQAPRVWRKERSDVVSAFAETCESVDGRLSQYDSLRMQPVGIAQSVLHLHSNRFFGLSRESEAHFLSTLRSCALKPKKAGRQ